MIDSRKTFYYAVVIFLMCLSMGFWLARHKPLWGDEIRSQGGSVSLDYAKIISGKHIGQNEGNVCPLFYLIQKGISDITRQHLSNQKWDTYLYDVRSQIILRIAPNVFMSLTFAIMFYFFACFYSIGTGIYALFLGLSSSMLWTYWAEARPYAQWIFLTTAQSLLFLSIIRKTSNNDKKNQILWRWLIVIHFFLAITVFFSLVQVTICSALLWIWVQRDWRKYISLAVIPTSVCLYYYAHAPRFEYRFDQTSWELLSANLPLEWILITLLYVVCTSVYLVCNHFNVQENIKRFPVVTKNRKLSHSDFLDKQLIAFNVNHCREGRTFMAFEALMIIAALFLMIVFKFATTQGDEKYVVYARYFIYLVPIVVIATTLFSRHLVVAFKENTWMRININMVLGALLITRCLKTAMQLIAGVG